MAALHSPRQLLYSRQLLYCAHHCQSDGSWYKRPKPRRGPSDEVELMPHTPNDYLKRALRAYESRVLLDSRYQV